MLFLFLCLPALFKSFSIASLNRSIVSSAPEHAPPALEAYVPRSFYEQQQKMLAEQFEQQKKVVLG